MKGEVHNFCSTKGNCKNNTSFQTTNPTVCHWSDKQIARPKVRPLFEPILCQAGWDAKKKVMFEATHRATVFTLFREINQQSLAYLL